MTRLVTKSAIIETFLADLDAAKERGIVGAEIVTPAWAGLDSDVRTGECAICYVELPDDAMLTCGHCGRLYCALCPERHGEWVQGRRL